MQWKTYRNKSHKSVKFHRPHTKLYGQQKFIWLTLENMPPVCSSKRKEKKIVSLLCNIVLFLDFFVVRRTWFDTTQISVTLYPNWFGVNKYLFKFHAFLFGVFSKSKKVLCVCTTSAVVYCENTCSSSTEYYYNKCQHKHTHKADRHTTRADS